MTTITYDWKEKFPKYYGTRNRKYISKSQYWCECEYYIIGIPTVPLTTDSYKSFKCSKYSFEYVIGVRDKLLKKNK